MADERRDAPSAPIAWYVLALGSFSAAVVACSLMFVTLGLNNEMVAAKDPCSSVTPAGRVFHIIADIHTSLLADGAAVVLSWGCTLLANRSAFGATPEQRRALLVLSTLALVGCACSFGMYSLSSTCMEFA
jgi:hypothetical protein